MKALRVIGSLVLALLLVAAIGYWTRSDPVGPISGRALDGAETAYPASWQVCNEHRLIALEVRPENPYSVNVLCFVHDGDLYLPVRDLDDKTWPALVAQNPVVRVKIGSQIYPALAVRETQIGSQTLAPSLLAKYAQMAAADPVAAPDDVVYFRIEPRAQPNQN